MRKVFSHAFVPAVEMKDEIIDGRRYYTTPTGAKLWSVTTLLGEKLDHSGLDTWKERVGEEEAARVSAVATRRGAAMHKIAESYVLNEENFYRGHMPINVEMFKSIRPILDEHVDNILGIELPLYNAVLGVAGRTDLVAQYDDITSIIDFKTSSRQKEEGWIETYFLQTTIYSLMFEWMYRIKTPQIVVIIAVEHDTPQVFVKDRNEYIGRILELTQGN